MNDTNNNTTDNTTDNTTNNPTDNKEFVITYTRVPRRMTDEEMDDIYNAFPESKYVYESNYVPVPYNDPGKLGVFIAWFLMVVPSGIVCWWIVIHVFMWAFG